MGGEWRSCLLPRESGAITAREQMPNPYVNPVCVYVYRTGLLLRYLREHVWYKGLWRKVIWLKCYGHCDAGNPVAVRGVPARHLYCTLCSKVSRNKRSPVVWLLRSPSFLVPLSPLFCPGGMNLSESHRNTPSLHFFHRRWGCKQGHRTTPGPLQNPLPCPQTHHKLELHVVQPLP